ncbi:MAG TPA: hypothetical protein VM686_28740 [Polyangiaceae bacterium]|nr:hypothetical protein [Polyangiaceae bacterium]
MGAVSRFGFFLVGAVSLAGCFGSSDDDDDDSKSGGSCSAVQGCGGDPVGVWEIVDSCASVATTGQTGCAAGTTYGPVEATGQFEFTADGQVISTINLTMQATLRFTEQCLSEQTGQAVTIDQAACDSIATGAGQAEGVTSVSCTLSGSACVCPSTFQSMAGGTGTWTASGNNLIDEDGTVLPYCVNGDTLSFSGSTEGGTLGYTLRRVP